MKMLQLYQTMMASGEIISDPNQLGLVNQLAATAEALDSVAKASFFSRFNKTRHYSPHSVYLWGSVGSGKTWLMNLFYYSLKTPRKRKIHYHAFMSQIHRRLAACRERKDPIKLVVAELKKDIDILCLDEFVVTDIADGMILYQLLTYLFEADIFLMLTSNTAPAHLYEGGLQRRSFLPAIALIKAQMQVVELSLEQDYRLHEQIYPQFIYPESQNLAKIRTRFEQELGNKPYQTEPLQVHGRPIAVLAKSQHLVWFDFNQLCNIPRSQEDYLALAQNYHSFYLSHLRQIKPSETHLAVLLIELIDILYDQQIKLTVSSHDPIDHLYPHGRVAEAFKRTESRLKQMCGNRWPK